MFATLPTEINRVVGSFLDLNSRVNFYRILPTNDDKFVKKIDSDKHNCAVKVAQMTSLLDKIQKEENQNKRAVLTIRFLCRLRNTKDTWFYKYPQFIKTAYGKACELADRSHPGIASIPSKRIRNGLLQSALMCKAKFYVTFTWEELGITVE